jgi:phosphoribosylglycinamide formyltransferase 1
MKSRVPVAVFISGNGSNLQALIDASRDPSYPAEIKLVISNCPDAYGLQRAENAGISTCIAVHEDFASRADFDAAVHEVLMVVGVKIVCLAGFMRLLTPAMTKKWEGRMLNIHPSLLPAYKGLNTHKRVLEAGERETGCTVHYVTAEMDAGEIILQERVTIAADDTVETLQQRVHAAEHRIYPEALRRVAARFCS